MSDCQNPPTPETVLEAFETLCRIPQRDAVILYETRTVPTTDGAQFCLTLIRQYTDSAGEPQETRAELLCPACEETRAFNETVWELPEEDIFGYIRRSPAFHYLQHR